jgi:hypothetical protein
VVSADYSTPLGCHRRLSHAVSVFSRSGGRRFSNRRVWKLLDPDAPVHAGCRAKQPCCRLPPNPPIRCTAIVAAVVASWMMPRPVSFTVRPKWQNANNFETRRDIAVSSYLASRHLVHAMSVETGQPVILGRTRRDAAEARRAWREKRKPDWQGR